MGVSGELGDGKPFQPRKHDGYYIFPSRKKWHDGFDVNPISLVDF